MENLIRPEAKKENSNCNSKQLYLHTFNSEVLLPALSSQEVCRSEGHLHQIESERLSLLLSNRLCPRPSGAPCGGHSVVLR